MSSRGQVYAQGVVRSRWGEVGGIGEYRKISSGE